MITFEEARNIISTHLPEKKSRSVPLDEALGFVLAENIVAPFDIPRFDSSAVDGFALHSSALDVQSRGELKTLHISGMIRTGDPGNAIVRKREAVKIFTGAPISRGTAAVIMKEHVGEEDGKLTLHRNVLAGENIRKAGGEFRKGQIVVNIGERLGPAHIGMIASLGVSRVRILKAPVVGIIVTGNELKRIGALLTPGKIFESNSFALSSALKSIRIDPAFLSRCRDDKQSMTKLFKAALAKVDILISVGGISVGDYDFVKEVLLGLKVREHFHSIAIKPGKPNYFGTRGKKLVFGLPGNPVSALLSFYTLIRPALLQMMGIVESNDTFQAKLQTELKKKAGRMEFVRVRLSKTKHGGFLATPTTGQASHMLSGLFSAEALYRFPIEKELVKKGSIINVEPIHWSIP